MEKSHKSRRHSKMQHRKGKQHESHSREGVNSGGGLSRRILERSKVDESGAEIER